MTAAPQRVYQGDIYDAIDPTKGLKDAANGKVVLVTGAASARGLGPHMCVAFARAGAAVVAMGDKSVSGLKETAAKVAAANPKTKVIELALDVSSLESCKKAIETVIAEAGRLDVLVNNAGISELWVDFLESDPEEWWRTHEVNQRGTFFMCRLAIPQMLKNEPSKTGTRGVVVNVASIAGVMVVPTASSYSVSKAAVIRLTEFIDTEIGHEGIVAIAIHPCAADTAMQDPFRSKENVRGQKGWEILKPFLTDNKELAGAFALWCSTPAAEPFKGRYLSANDPVDWLLHNAKEVVEKDLFKLKLANLA
ncbi:hypothetical protein DFJ74DRAFT_499765 [Hyaloraphidium curvatum]|nr:hypothetical protein DFJ74DRAFT_499765 [Hyaloraphidium curvatum]